MIFSKTIWTMTIYLLRLLGCVLFSVLMIASAAADQTGQAAQQVLSAAEQLSSQSRDLAGHVNRFLAEVRAA